MLFSADTWPGIADGSITCAFRAWTRPTVKEGGTLITPAGQLGVDEVSVIEPRQITDADAVAAGFADRREVLARLDLSEGRRVHRVRFHRIGEDPRIALAGSVPDDAERREIERRLAACDAAAEEAWTLATLEQIQRSPGVVSTLLAREAGIPRDLYKRRVRRLKELGLTESLEVGYRLTVRGESLLAPTDPF